MWSSFTWSSLATGFCCQGVGLYYFTWRGGNDPAATSVQRLSLNTTCLSGVWCSYMNTQENNNELRELTGFVQEIPIMNHFMCLARYRHSFIHSVGFVTMTGVDSQSLGPSRSQVIPSIATVFHYPIPQRQTSSVFNKKYGLFHCSTRLVLYILRSSDTKFRARSSEFKTLVWRFFIFH